MPQSILAKWQTTQGLKFIGIVIGLLFIGSLYIHYLDEKRHKVLQNIALPLIQTCKQKKRCIAIPDGFNTHYNKQDELTMINHQSHPMMVYKTYNKDEKFTLNWRVATGTTFRASGGVNDELSIVKVID